MVLVQTKLVRRAAFPLIELLVVIAIIAIVAAFLFLPKLEANWRRVADVRAGLR